MSKPIPIRVYGPKEGVVSMTTKGGRVWGYFKVSLSGCGGPGCIVLYRIRVKEPSILFSQTYGILDMAKEGASKVDSVFFCADQSVVQSGYLSTIHVEYTALTRADAETVYASNIHKNTCRPFFSRSGVGAYDVHCVMEDKRAWLTYIIVASVAVAGAVSIAAVTRRYYAAVSLPKRLAER